MIEEIRYSLADRNLSVVADLLDINYQTLIRISNGETKKPSHKTLSKLYKYLGIENRKKIHVLKEIAEFSAITGLVIYSIDRVIKGECPADEAADYIRSVIVYGEDGQYE